MEKKYTGDLYLEGEELLAAHLLANVVARQEDSNPDTVIKARKLARNVATVYQDQQIDPTKPKGYTIEASDVVWFLAAAYHFGNDPEALGGTSAPAVQKVIDELKTIG